jgi:hypothetical protein
MDSGTTLPRTDGPRRGGANCAFVHRSLFHYLVLDTIRFGRLTTVQKMDTVLLFAFLIPYPAPCIISHSLLASRHSYDNDNARQSRPFSPELVFPCSLD